jgi:hypothetical protein
VFAKYGSYTHDDNEVLVTSFTQRTQFARGLPQLVKKTLAYEVVLIPASASQASIRSAIQALEAAYSRQGQDAGLYHDDGSASPHVLDSGSSIGGVRVLSLDYPQGDGGEYATARTATITLEADYPVSGDVLLSFSESLRFVGTCGPRKVWAQVLNGAPQRQTVNQRTTQTITQSGSAVGWLAEPRLPGPLFPSLEHVDRREVSPGAPTLEGQRFVNWPLSWTYHFESASPLNARPHRR